LSDNYSTLFFLLSIGLFAVNWFQSDIETVKTI